MAGARHEQRLYGVGSTAGVRYRPMAVPRLWLSPLPVTPRCGSTIIGKGRDKSGTGLREGTRESGARQTVLPLSCLTRRAA
jgi:hypothetical protein